MWSGFNKLLSAQLASGARVSVAYVGTFTPLLSEVHFSRNEDVRCQINYALIA